MASQVQTQSNQAQQQASHHFQEIEKIYPNLQEPHRGAMANAVKTAHHPHTDARLCAVAGKVAVLTVNFKDKIDGDDVVLRGNVGPLRWDANYAADSHSVQNPHERTFTFHIPPSQNGDTMEFKLFNTKANAWSNNTGNWPVNLGDFGHHVVLGPMTVGF